MAMNAHHPERFLLRTPEVTLTRLLQSNAEFIGALACSQIGMTFDIDIGIDAHRDRRHLANVAGDLRRDFQLLPRLDIEGQDMRLDRKAYLVICFTDAGKNDLGRRNARTPRRRRGIPSVLKFPHLRSPLTRNKYDVDNR